MRAVIRDDVSSARSFKLEIEVRSPGFEPGFSALLLSVEWRADVLDQAFPSVSRMTGRQPHTSCKEQTSQLQYM